MNQYSIIKKAGFHCRWCDAAEMLMRRTNQWYRVSALSDEYLDAVAEQHQMRTIPIIFCNDKLIGGHDELVTHLKKEGLLPDDYEA